MASQVQSSLRWIVLELSQGFGPEWQAGEAEFQQCLAGKGGAKRNCFQSLPPRASPQRWSTAGPGGGVREALSDLQRR